MVRSSGSIGPTVDVVVIGAGPVGMTAAVLLSAFGASVLVVERNPGTSNEPKAISLDDESLRTLQAAGLIDELMPIITPGTGTRYFGADGRYLFQARGGLPFRLGHPFKNPFAQPDLERVLLDALQRDPRVSVQFNTDFESIQQDGDGVTVRLRDLSGGLTSEIRCAFVLGCDGGRSKVREQLGITMTGRSHPETWLVVDTLNDPHDERYGMHYGDPDRPRVIIPGLGGRCRYEFLLLPGEGQPNVAPEFDLIKRLVSVYRDIAPEDVERATNYRFHGLVADEWQSGRCLLLGDAAHMMPPFAGQGLNSGIRDAANLGWKVAGVVHGILTTASLSTYQAERKPHAAATVRLSERLGRIVMTTNGRLAERRDALVRRALDTAKGRAYFEEMQYRPTVDFSKGMVVPDDDLVGVAGHMIAQPRVFDSQAHRVRPLDELLGSGWSLLAVGLPDDAWQSPLPARVGSLRPSEVTVDDRLPPPQDSRLAAVDVDGALEREFGRLRRRFVLVRPDRFIAASWTPGIVDRVSAGLAPYLSSVDASSASATEETR